ncbi:MAG: hypothetical protein FJ009_21925 [Chloroflexi bacterium]|nr:hypothetical protein [Chloroflexota bacterium]
MKINQSIRVFSLCATLATLLSFASAAASAQSIRATNALVLLDSTGSAQMERAITFIQAQGGRAPITFAPRALLAKLPERDVSNWVGQAGIAEIITTPADADRIELDYGDQAGLAARGWNGILQKARAPRQTLPPGNDLIDDALVAPDLPVRAPNGVSAPPTSDYTSMFMYGAVQVDVFLAESNGTIDANTENWTTPMRDNVVSEITTGLNWWVTAATQGGRPAANLTFNLTFHTPFNEPNVVATGYEPINRPRPLSTSMLWIGNIMTNLGYSATFAGVRQYANARRNATGRDWAYSIFVANSYNDADGLFTNGYSAYAYLNGPFMVMTYDNDGWGISRMDMVSTHETGHIFSALDEYAASKCTTTEKSGYLNIANTNCENGTPTEESIMRSGESMEIAYPSYLASTPVRGMIGWRDSDADGIYDVADTSVQMSATRTTTPGVGQPVSYAGTATDIPFPSPKYPAMSVNKITQVRYRVDYGAWSNATANDGAFNSYTESFKLTTAPLTRGTHTVEIRGLNSVGNYASFTQNILLDPWRSYLPLIKR